MRTTILSSSMLAHTHAAAVATTQAGSNENKSLNNCPICNLDILHTTQSSGVSTPGLDGEMYYGQLEEILELTYIGPRKVVLFRCKWFDTINPKNHTTRNRRSYIDQGIHHILTDREFHQNNQYILATQATQVFYLEDLARRPLHWKVVEHVYHRDVAESDQDVIHGSSSSDVALSVGLTVLESTDLSINAQSTEVDAPPVNEDNANANEDNADFINNEDDVVAHVLDDDDVEVSDDDEVNPSTNVEEMACVAPRSHGGDAGGNLPRQPTGPVPAQCQGSTIHGVKTNRALKRAFRDNREEPLTAGFDIGDQGTFHPLGVNASYLNSLMGEQIRPPPLDCEWKEIPPAYKAHILPTLESYFNLAIWYNRQDKVVVDDNVYTVVERVRLGLELKLRLLWRKHKTRIKAQHFKIHETPDDAKAHMPPPKVWDDRTQEDWEELVDSWSHPDM
ncbi:Myc-type, basic helix-loop-helix domain-containing protein [Tanacetum coccineum]